MVGRTKRLPNNTVNVVLLRGKCQTHKFAINQMAEKQLTHSEHGAFVAPEGLGPQGQSNLGKAIRTWRVSLKGRFIGFTAEDEVTFTYSLQTVEVAIG